MWGKEIPRIVCDNMSWGGGIRVQEVPDESYWQGTGCYHLYASLDSVTIPTSLQ